MKCILPNIEIDGIDMLFLDEEEDSANWLIHGGGTRHRQYQNLTSMEVIYFSNRISRTCWY